MFMMGAEDSGPSAAPAARPAPAPSSGANPFGGTAGMDASESLAKMLQAEQDKFSGGMGGGGAANGRQTSEELARALQAEEQSRGAEKEVREADTAKRDTLVDNTQAIAAQRAAVHRRRLEKQRDASRWMFPPPTALM